jgi:hypothetical protein
MALARGQGKSIFELAHRTLKQVLHGFLISNVSGTRICIVFISVAP